MVETRTTRLQLPHYSDANTDGPEMPDWNEAVTQLDDQVAIDTFGTFASRPAAGTRGRYYYATDTNILYRDNATTWDVLSAQPSSALPATLGVSSGITGTGADYARSDHRHPLTYAAPGSSAPGQGTSAGAASSLARSDHQHGREAWGAAPSSSSPGQASATGVAAAVARGDHVHGREAFATTVSQVSTLSATAGSATTVPRGDHRHTAVTAVAAQLYPGMEASVGDASSLALSDHRHQMLAGAPTPSVPGDIAAEGAALAFARTDHVHGRSDELLTSTATDLNASPTAYPQGVSMQYFAASTPGAPDTYTFVVTTFKYAGTSIWQMAASRDSTPGADQKLWWRLGYSGGTPEWGPWQRVSAETPATTSQRNAVDGVYSTTSTSPTTSSQDADLQLAIPSSGKLLISLYGLGRCGGGFNGYMGFTLTPVTGTLNGGTAGASLYRALTTDSTAASTDKQHSLTWLGLWPTSDAGKLVNVRAAYWTTSSSNAVYWSARSISAVPVL